MPIVSAHAADPPLPPRKENLEQIEQRLEQKKERQAILAEKREAAEKQLKNTQDSLVAVADSIRANEKNLQSLDRKISDLSRQNDALTMELEGKYGSISHLVLALARIRRIPPEALMVRPGAPLQTAQTALLLENILPAVKEQTEKISQSLERLSVIQKTLAADKEKVVAARAALTKKKTEMSALLKERQSLYEKTDEAYNKNRQSIDTIAAQAQSMRDLLDRLKEEDRRQAGNSGKSQKREPGDQPSNETPSRWSRVLSRAFQGGLPETGDARLPTLGRVLVDYGQKDSIGARSEGLSLEAAPDSLVVAPMGGKVRFTGKFKNYGQLVIIEHAHDYHSLVAGLARIDTVVGQTLKAGEPLGVLPPSSSRGGKPVLYYELRHKGQPVDPAKKFSGLKS